MTRRKVDTDLKLTRKFTVRVSDPFFKKLEIWLKHSNCHSVSELARRILYKEKINWYHRHVELETVALELSGIRKELNAMGRNINQVVRHFNSTQAAEQKLFAATKVAGEYKRVGQKVDELLVKIAHISKKWLQE